MRDRVEMLAAALDLLEEGVVVLDLHANVVLWNRAAAELTGYLSQGMLSRPCPEELYRVEARSLRKPGAGGAAPVAGFGGAVAGWTSPAPEAADEGFLLTPVLVTLRHRLGHALPATLRRMPLRDADGARVGVALLFHAVEEAEALPHGECGDGSGVERGQAEMEERLERAQHQWAINRVPFGLLWATVDQAACLRKTHGKGACESMLRILEQTLTRGLRPTEVVGRWGDDEFLVVSPERTEEMLLEHAQRLAGLARTAEFRWWGDRVSLTLSVGAAHVGRVEEASGGDALGPLLERARRAMQASLHAGGNHV
ncbi:MAG TPA: diguanylate cyclase, partial [Granulicella sp.]|nr:diguanylate cyclase [Granulicella sp.]